jgi:hypothetical protein
MIELETWISMGSLGMAIMFVLLMISFYLFLLGPDKKGPNVFVDPEGVLIQIVSISGAPSLILAGTSVGFQKKHHTKLAALILVVVGILLLAGMIAVVMITPKINASFLAPGIDSIPYIFIIGGTAIAGVGAYLIKKSKNYGKNLEDEVD